MLSLSNWNCVSSLRQVLGPLRLGTEKGIRNNGGFTVLRRRNHVQTPSIAYVKLPLAFKELQGQSSLPPRPSLCLPTHTPRGEAQQTCFA